MDMYRKLKEKLTGNSLRSEFSVIWKSFYNNVIAYVLLYAQNVMISRYMPTESLGQYSYTQSLLILLTSIYSMEAYSAYLRFIGITNEKKLLKRVRQILFIGSVLFSITVFAFFESPFYILFVGYMLMRVRMTFFRS